MLNTFKITLIKLRTKYIPALGSQYLFFCLLAIVTILQAYYVLNSLMFNRLGFDSAMNLSVARNMGLGFGYSADSLFGSPEKSQFEVQISTGPTVLLPMALGFLTSTKGFLAARLVMVAWYFLFILGSWLLGKQLFGKWAALAGIAFPLFVNPFLDSSWAELQGPTDILGEIPAATLVIWSLVLLKKNKTLSALCLGLAVLTKTIVLISIPAFIAAYIYFLSRGGTNKKTLARHVFSFSAATLLPNLAWEIIIFCTLGSDGYLFRIQNFASFFLKGGSGLNRNWMSDPTQGLRSFIYFFQSPPIFVIIGFIFILLALGLWFGKQSNLRNGSPQENLRWINAILIFSSFNFAIWSYWWFFQAGAQWTRSFVPVLLLSGSVFFPFLMASIMGQIKITNLKGKWFRGFILISAIFLTFTASSSSIHKIPNVPFTLQKQLKVVNFIHKMDLKEISVVQAAHVSEDIAILSNLSFRTRSETNWPTENILIVKNWGTRTNPEDISQLQFIFCEATIYDSEDYLLCAPKSPSSSR